MKAQESMFLILYCLISYKRLNSFSEKDVLFGHACQVWVESGIEAGPAHYTLKTLMTKESSR